MQIVIPLLSALGFSINDVAPKVRVELKEGSKPGRPFEADFVAYSEALHDRDTSLMVVEVKKPGQCLVEARNQGESYAMALRAPALLLTDGVVIQVWQLQPTLENKLVLECPIAGIKAKRGSIELLISKQALIAHASNLAHKKLAATPDFGKYESGELVRIKEISRRAISRILRSDSGSPISSEDLLEKYRRGAIIIAPSGYGKTTLAAELLRQSIKNRWLNTNAALSIDVPLVDLDASRLPIIEFVHARIVAHHPEVTISTIQDIARNHGLLLVCDGFERVAAETRSVFESQMRQITRDFPKSVLFVFSRGSVAPRLELPRIQLQLLSKLERKMMVDKLTGTNFPLSLMPRLLIELSEIPLILDRITAFWIASKRFPTRIEELFDHWMVQLFGDTSPSPTATVLRDKILLAFAHELGVRHLTPPEALTLTTVNGGNAQIFDALVQCGVLVMSNTTVEFVHEGLADHLRARAFAALPESALRAALATIHIDEDSMLPVMLAALVKDPASRDCVWKRLREMSLPRYIDAICFSEDAGTPFTTSNLQLTERNFFEDMANSIEALVDTFFPSIAAELRGCLTHQRQPIDGFSLIGNISPEPNGSLIYTLQPGATNSIEIGHPTQGASYHGVNLSSVQIGVGDGRYMGAIAVRDALNDLVKQRRFCGGVTLSNERTIGRLRFMHEEYNFSVNPQESLSDLLQRLQPIKDRVVAPGPFNRTVPPFTIANMIGDLELLLSNGHERLNWWWLQYGTPAEILGNRQRTEGFLREHYSRAMALYSEIVTASFARVSDEFSLFQVMPVRWQLAILTSQMSKMTMQYCWLPVATEIEAGVDVAFHDTPVAGYLGDDAHVLRLTEALAQLGRNVTRYSIAGAGPFPEAGSRNMFGQFTGETSAMRMALDYLEDDVEDLFGDLPSRGPTLGDFPFY